MTNDEAVAYIIRHCNPDYPKGKTEWEISINIFFDALRNLPTQMSGASEDTISRQAAIETIDTVGFDFSESGLSEVELEELHEGISEVVQTMIQRINHLPSAQPETAKRIVGKSRNGMTMWYQCDMCNEPVDANDAFCRGCGRRLTYE